MAGFQWRPHPMPGWFILSLNNVDVAQLERFDGFYMWHTLEGLQINRRNLINKYTFNDLVKEDGAKAHVETEVRRHIEKVYKQHKELYEAFTPTKTLYLGAACDLDNDEPLCRVADNERALEIYLEFRYYKYNEEAGRTFRMGPAATVQGMIDDIKEAIEDEDFEPHLNQYQKYIQKLEALK